MKLMSNLFCLSSSEKKKEKRNCSSMASRSSHDRYSWEVFKLKEILQATNNFSENYKLGEGGFGTVYWGRTASGEEIAVKRLKAMTPKAEMEFAVEVEVLARVRHKNLLGLRGYYAGGSERLIVYEYMPNHSLVSHLHGHFAGEARLHWPRRMAVAVSSAEGLAYLHHEAKPHIIHRDIKASNVLLDGHFRPKVADFGFAKLIPDGVSHLTTRVKGTLGYLAPEYAMWGKVTHSCDVYSFGILLLELISGRKPIERISGRKKRDILQWARPVMEDGRWDLLADPRLAGRVDLAQLKAVAVAAVKCTDGYPDNRPTMREVVQMLRDGVAPRRTKEVPAAAAATEDGDPVEKEGSMVADDDGASRRSNASDDHLIFTR